MSFPEISECLHVYVCVCEWVCVFVCAVYLCGIAAACVSIFECTQKENSIERQLRRTETMGRISGPWFAQLPNDIFVMLLYRRQE